MNTRTNTFILLRTICLLFAAMLICFAKTGFCSNYSMIDETIDKIKKRTLLKPYITLGYHSSLPLISGSPNCTYNNGSGAVPVECSTYEQMDRQHFFADIATFKNWQIGVGVRLHQYFALEITYDSFEKQMLLKSPPGSAYPGEILSTPSGLASGQWVTFNAVFYTPPIDVKVGTIEFSIAPGIAIPFAFRSGLNSEQTGSTVEYTNAVSTMGTVPGFSITAAVTFGLKQPISLSLYAQAITFHQNLAITTANVIPQVFTYDASSPVLLLIGGKVNFYVL